MNDHDFSRTLASRLVQVAERIKADFATAVLPFDLSVPAARALLLMDEPIPMRVLSDRLACDQSYITRIADELEARGYVQRAPASDRRIQLLTMTPNGTRVRESLSDAVKTTNRVHHRLSEPERDALDCTLARLLSD